MSILNQNIQRRVVMILVTQLQVEASGLEVTSVVSVNVVCPYEMRSSEICHVFYDD